jgi:hypothetical protein
MNNDGAAIRTLPSPTVGFGRVTNVKIVNSTVDMNGANGVGIMLESGSGCSIDDPTVTGMITGTFSWTDKFATGQIWPNCGVVIKGTPGHGDAQYNRVRNIRTVGPGGLFGVAGASSPVGLWLGTSVGGGNNQKANFNKVEGGLCGYGGRGVVMSVGNDNIIDIDGSANDVCYQLGDLVNTTPVQRNTIVRAYMENYISAGIHSTAYASGNSVLSFGSWFQQSGFGPSPLIVNDGVSPAFSIGLGPLINSPPGAQPTITGSRGGATAAVLADLLTAIADTGLIIDGTTA